MSSSKTSVKPQPRTNVNNIEMYLYQVAMGNTLKADNLKTKAYLM